MLYLANPSSPAIVAAMVAGQLGYMDTPRQRNRRPAGVTWGADNGCFGKGYPGDEPWMAWLVANQRDAARCLFATAPDVVGDAAATLARSLPWLPRIRALGYPAALVAQDGLTPETTPWAQLDVLFIGGTTAWKEGPEVRTLCAEAARRGVPVHVGRVNSRRRLHISSDLGAASCDGTLLAFGPDKHLPSLLRWLDEVEQQAKVPRLFGVA